MGRARAEPLHVKADCVLTLDSESEVKRKKRGRSEEEMEERREGGREGGGGASAKERLGGKEGEKNPCQRDHLQHARPGDCADP